MKNCDIGMIGVGVMGSNLSLNMESKGFSVSVYDRDQEVSEAFVKDRASGKKISAVPDLPSLIDALARPRKVMLMIKTGKPIDAVIAQLIPLMEAGDTIIDGGNSLFTETRRRAEELQKKEIHFLGVGISGGEKGAREGPSIMPGGSPEAWESADQILRAIAAKVDGEPCCRYMGPDGAGHYVKMVHNGIEYGDIQLICESYNLLKSLLGLSADDLADIFHNWNEGDLNSYLIDITSKIFRKKDPETNEPLVDRIQDTAGQKGTGIWTAESALELTTPASVINAAVEARILSHNKEERIKASKTLQGPPPKPLEGDQTHFIEAIRDALYASKIICYAQGLNLLQSASIENNWNLNLADIATIWRGGCIIRARFLDRIKEAYERNPNLTNLLLDPYFQKIIESTHERWRQSICAALDRGIPVPAFSAAISYYDSYRQERLPANLLQAQRDFFGAHTYERIDKPGSFHTEWEKTS